MPRKLHVTDCSSKPNHVLVTWGAVSLATGLIIDRNVNLKLILKGVMCLWKIVSSSKIIYKIVSQKVQMCICLKMIYM